MGKTNNANSCPFFAILCRQQVVSPSNPQAPVVQRSTHGLYKLDDYDPNNTNAIMAVLSYTGFDMEYAMILNKCNYETRGFGDVSVLQDN
jgi:DNA-directed RNA polymerase I subunit RPA2